MLYYTPASTQPIRDAIKAGLLGHIRQPDGGGHVLVPGIKWTADNGCFNPQRFTVAKWQEWLDRQPRTCAWATVPDVVGDHPATVARWAEHAPWVIDHGFAPAFVAQDGCVPSEIPQDAACVFIGGTTAWKLSAAAQACVREAQHRGIVSHMGRVNSLRRLRVAAQWGCDSVDGTYLTFGPDVNLPRLLAYLYPDAAGFWGVA